jgi:hypothetical protein
VRFARPAVVAIAAVLGFGACTSQPSAKAVAQDYVESIPDLSETERQCMLDKLDNYTSDELEAIGDANLTVDWDQPSAAAVASGTPELQKLVDDLGTCMAGSS